MPKAKDERKLYERCWGCRGTRKTEAVFNEGRPGELPAGSPCPLCADGYFEVGLTVGQLEAMVDQSRAVAGDPGIPADRRLAILTRLEGKVRTALARLRQEGDTRHAGGAAGS